MWQHYFQPASLPEALELLRVHAREARIVSGGTDVLVELQRGIRPTTTLIDITALLDLKYVRQTGEQILLGGLATHNDVVASSACVHRGLPLAQACYEVGAPQIRTRGTVAGNLITASPANDTITPLMALGAEVVLQSASSKRVVQLQDFYRGVRQTVLRPDELLTEIRFPALRDNQRGCFLKLGLRRAQAISVINIAFVLTYDGDVVVDARIALGCLAPTIMRAVTAEDYLRGKMLDDDVCAEAGRFACADVSPISDLRGSADYRLSTLAALVAEGLGRIATGAQAQGWPSGPVLLETPLRTSERGDHAAPVPNAPPSLPLQVIETTINGRGYQLAPAEGKSLLDALRDDAGLVGTKEGCAEGECGACTVWLNGQAVMACLVPAPQAHGALLTTIEGLHSVPTSDRQLESGDYAGRPLGMAPGEALHPLQAAFIEGGAVQCGYCIPGMLMAGAKLLQEHEHPDHTQTQVALSGNICRCTGYRKILEAVQAASQGQNE